ncbi:hypothetical protein TNCV_3762961 [Trichonephila clavipes]|uniref:Uncharacterized protein n=1 Tax=Trichonephila clavipes TaxID=2585209 RepID=A0A8X7B883_TRICX|nr:hypothetical protein TNCV_3762961 [Trichonephila clavipes]
MRVDFYDVRAHRPGCEIALSRNIQDGTDHCAAFKILRKIFLFTELKKEKPGFEPETSQSEVEYFTTELTIHPVSASLCFAFHRNSYENALSRNMQNMTNHSRLQNSQKIFLFTSLKKRTTGFEPRTYRSAVKCYHISRYSLIPPCY